MNVRRRGSLLLGLLGAVVVLVALLFVVGSRRVLETLSTADPALVAATFALGLCWLFSWSLMLRTVLVTLAVELPVGKAFLVYAGAVFANNVTPFGQAGGEPVAALLISRVSRARYETGLVGIGSVDVVNVVASVWLVLLGVGYYATSTTVGERLETAVATAIALVCAICVLFALTWRHRRALTVRTAGAVATVATRLRPRRFDRATVEETVVARAARFFEHVERVATSPRRLAVTLSFSVLGWLFQSAALAAAFAAVGHTIPISVALFVVPLGNLAGATPLPGGLGGVEAAFVALLVPTTGVAAPAVTAAVLVFRAAIYWMPILIGGGSVTAFGVRSLA